MSQLRHVADRPVARSSRVVRHRSRPRASALLHPGGGVIFRMDAPGHRSGRLRPPADRALPARGNIGPSSTGIAVRTIQETALAGPLPLFQHPGWEERLPWLVQGVTGRGPARDPFDLAFFGSEGGGDPIWLRWRRVAEATAMPRLVQGRQVHGSTVRLHGPGQPGVLLVDDTDGHATAEPGLLLSVTIADCVPVFLVAPEARGVALLHAGWRGIAAGILEAGVSLLEAELGVSLSDLLVHAGPAVCGRCYEVGPEVHRALGLPDPGMPAPVDLRALIVERAVSLGVRDDDVTVSEWCTLCGDSPFFSHRGGDPERQAAILGIRGGGAGSGGGRGPASAFGSGRASAGPAGPGGGP